MSPLPPHASLDHLKHQAKDLLRGLCAKDPAAKERALAHLPRRRQNAEPKLADAQLIVAREYGDVSWPRMKEYLERLAAATGEDVDDPSEVRITSALSDPSRTTGAIRISDSTRFPHTEWTITVPRNGPDRLASGLALDRIDTTLPTQ